MIFRFKIFLFTGLTPVKAPIKPANVVVVYAVLPPRVKFTFITTVRRYSVNVHVSFGLSQPINRPKSKLRACNILPFESCDTIDVQSVNSS